MLYVLQVLACLAAPGTAQEVSDCKWFQADVAFESQAQCVELANTIKMIEAMGVPLYVFEYKCVKAQDA